MTPSLITDVLAAHVEKRKTHTVESLLESRLLMTHNDPVAHWSDNHGNRNDNPEYPNSNRIERLQIGMDSYQEQGFVKDEHAWYFTPETFESIINDLNKLGLINQSDISVQCGSGSHLHAPRDHRKHQVHPCLKCDYEPQPDPMG